MNIENFSKSFKKWSLLTDKEREFFCGEEHLPFHENHEERISVLFGNKARNFIDRALHQIPEYNSGVKSKKRTGDCVLLKEVWNNEAKSQEVRQWLHDRGLPFETIVYLLYDNQVVRTDWKFLVTYWDALVWNIGVAMVATDLTV